MAEVHRVSDNKDVTDYYYPVAFISAASVL